MDPRVGHLETLLSELREAYQALESEMETLSGVPSNLLRDSGGGKVLALQDALSRESRQRQDATEGQSQFACLNVARSANHRMCSVQLWNALRRN